VLSREARECCYRALVAGARVGAVSIGVGAASAHEIDRINILRASLLAMARAVAVLELAPGGPPDIALVDGNVAPGLPCAVHTIVKGDALSFSIAAASVIAKVTRDRITPHHRRSFAPVRLAISGAANFFALLDTGAPAGAGELAHRWCAPGN
jgi:ribonuclease HII